MAKTYHPSLTFRLGLFITTTMLRVGMSIGGMTLLTVRGRKSGQLRTTPVTIVKHNGQRWITAPFGAVNWVRNLRAAGVATLSVGRHTETISATELPTREAALVLKEHLGSFPSFIRQYYNVTPTSSPEEFEAEAPLHPVFLVKSLPEQQGTESNAPEGKALFS
jgi:deazaflavin-dependent oxidoreductase (nitroreductase family)